jgi:hypothetical protein
MLFGKQSLGREYVIEWKFRRFFSNQHEIFEASEMPHERLMIWMNFNDWVSGKMVVMF